MGHGPHRPFVSRREFLQRTAVAGLATATGTWFWQRPAFGQAVPVEQLHGQFGSDAGREAAFSWMTPGAVDGPFLQLGGERIPAESLQYDGYPGWFHHVRVDDLLPATEYPYAVGHADAVISAEYTWRTGPFPGSPFTFTAFGDQGTDVPDPTSVQDVDPTSLQTIKVDQAQPFLASQNRDLARSMNPAFHAIVGDTSYANGDQAVWDEWFRGIAPMAAERPWMPCLGNHEIEISGVALGGFSISEQVGLPSEPWGELGYDSYRTRFALPPNGDPRWEGCWYRFRYGSVEFISIDNNDVNTEVPTNIGYSEGRQRAFVEQALGAAAADPNVDFIIVLMHQAAFSNGLHGNDQGVRDAWFDLFATHGVDLVIQGHDHHYERTHLMDHDQVVHASEEGTYVSDLGTMYVVAGNGGGVQRGEGLGSGADFTAAIASQQIGTLKVEVVPDTGEGTKRLILGEYSATLAGAPIEEGIVIERTRHPTAGTDEVTGAPREDATMEVTPVTGAPAGITAIGLAATAGAAAARSWVRGSTDDEVTELRARREER